MWSCMVNRGCWGFRLLCGLNFRWTEKHLDGQQENYENKREKRNFSLRFAFGGKLCFGTFSRSFQSGSCCRFSPFSHLQKCNACSCISEAFSQFLRTSVPLRLACPLHLYILPSVSRSSWKFVNTLWCLTCLFWPVCHSSAVVFVFIFIIVIKINTTPNTVTHNSAIVPRAGNLCFSVRSCSLLSVRGWADYRPCVGLFRVLACDCVFWKFLRF